MIKIDKSFCLEETIFSGQCFRITKNEKLYTLIINDRVLKIEETDKYYLINSSNEKNLQKVIENYFDLKRDYNKINRILIQKDSQMKKIIPIGHRILRQDRFEMLISYIISQNNNIKRISFSVNKLSELYGKKIQYEGEDFYLFPTIEQLLEVNAESLRECKLGFRDKYILEVLNVIKKDREFLDKIQNISTKDAMCRLMEIKGIGPKVASCILMFGYGRFDAYPIDTWAKKYLTSRFKIAKMNELKKVLYKKYGEYVGLAIQYMFNYERNKKS